MTYVHPSNLNHGVPEIEMKRHTKEGYRCLNCGEVFPTLKGAALPNLRSHWRATKQCSVNVLAYRQSGNPDCLDNPPGETS